MKDICTRLSRSGEKNYLESRSHQILGVTLNNAVLLQQCGVEVTAFTHSIYDRN